MMKSQEERERDSLESVINLKQTLHMATKNGVMQSHFLPGMWGNTMGEGNPPLSFQLLSTHNVLSYCSPSCKCFWQLRLEGTLHKGGGERKTKVKM